MSPHPGRIAVALATLVILAAPRAAHAAEIAPGQILTTTFPASTAECAAARAVRPERAHEPCVVTVTRSSTYTRLPASPSPSCAWYPGSTYIGESGPLGVWWFKETVSWQVNACLGLHNTGQNCDQWFAIGYAIQVTSCTAWHTWGMLVPPNDDGMCYWSGDNLTWQDHVSITWNIPPGIIGGQAHGVQISVESCGDPINGQSY